MKHHLKLGCFVRKTNWPRVRDDADSGLERSCDARQNTAMKSTSLRTGVSHRTSGHFLIFKTVTTAEGNHNETLPYVSSSLRFSVVKTCITSEKLGVSEPVKERRLTTAKGHENHKQTLPQASRRSWFASGRRSLSEESSLDYTL